MNAPESQWTEIVTTPEFSRWPVLLKQNHSFASNDLLTRLRQSARLRLIDAAQQYVLRLNEVARTAGLALASSEVLTGDPQTQPIVMTGHQPEMFHSGLTFKYDRTEEFATSQSAIAVAVSIDTDEGDPGAFQYPKADPAPTETPSQQLHLIQTSLCESSGLLSTVPLLSAEQLEDRAKMISDDLEQSADRRSREQFTNVMRDYARLAKADVKAAEANSIVRWSRMIGSRLLELPFSALCCFPEVLELTAGILASPKRFAQTYNNCLQEYRSVHGIRNDANPFPDLQIEMERTELPFWVMDTNAGTRHRLFVRLVDGMMTLFAGEQTVEQIPSVEAVDVVGRLLLRDVQLIPRAALITSFLRLLFADLFVHGIGGGHYDSFTTEFVRDWWNVDPPPFVVASASRYLYSDRREEILRLEALNQNLRDLRFNPQRHFDTGIFEDSVEMQLRRLSEQKRTMVAQLKSAQASGQSAQELGRRIQAVSDQMKQVVDEAFSDQLAHLANLTAQTEDAVHCRTYPWFLFPEL